MSFHKKSQANRAVRAVQRTHKINRLVKKLLGTFNRVFKVLIVTMDISALYNKHERFVYEDGDYVRNAALELAAREIAQLNIDGAVAELGVYRGDFAKLINAAFPERKLYLFDTFDGFDERQAEHEAAVNLSSGAEDFSDTGVEIVLRKMKSKANCVVRKGLFPQSAEGVDELFVFVSIDCDFYQPIYDGLCFFYPRLADGGTIFVHDYNSAAYLGAKQAVRQFARETGIAYFPLPDMNGSVVIIKGKRPT
ncbi:MAG: TylF/MycF family methyltransferase [Oscillospiraceae bacterium]|jgi:O-methyltransferase|nr:TylF/MycF family methyltransferase [Oscillospiraceae bacterium]